LLSFLEPPLLLVVAQVCRRLNEAASSDVLWRHFENDLGSWFRVGFFEWMRTEQAKARCRLRVPPLLGLVKNAQRRIPLCVSCVGDTAAKERMLISYTTGKFPSEVRIVCVAVWCFL
jgi:hypothetical protein